MSRVQSVSRTMSKYDSTDSSSSYTDDSDDDYRPHRHNGYRGQNYQYGQNHHRDRNSYRGQNSGSRYGHSGQNSHVRNNYRGQNGHDRNSHRGQNSRGGHNNRGQNRNDRSGQSGNDGQHRRRGMRMNKVNMPTGESVAITVPATSRCTCKKRNIAPKLIPLRPDGKMGKREYDIVEKEMKNTIKTGAAGAVASYTIVSIQKVVNCCLWKRFRNGQKNIATDVGYVNERMLFHGSPTVEDIIKTGFDERRSRLGGLFGAGIYFAEHSSKSNQYAGAASAAGEKKMLLCRVTLGKCEKQASSNQLAHPPPGFHSVQGEPTGYPEYVVYRGEQAYPEYLITYK